jgi:hypothetical protein
MKQSNQLPSLRIERRQIWALKSIAIGACERQIVQRIIVDMLLSENMLHVKYQEGCGGLGKSAILATIASATNHYPARGNIHERLIASQDFACVSLQDGYEVKCR